VDYKAQTDLENREIAAIGSIHTRSGTLFDDLVADGDAPHIQKSHG
jgi:hypothetical protein